MGTYQERIRIDGMAQASLILAILSVVLTLLPYLSIWLAFLTPIAYLLEVLAIIFGIIALVQKAPVTKPIIGIVLAIVSSLLPLLFADRLLGGALDVVSDIESML